MTREEAISVLEQAELKVGIKWRNGRPEVYISPYLQEAIDFALAELRPVSREQVEKVWRGCHHCLNSSARQNLGYQYCEHCGRPLTDEAVDMVMERLEAIQNG